MTIEKILHILTVAVVVAGLSMIGGKARESDREAVAGTTPHRIHTLFSVECLDYFDWQTVGLMHNYRKAKQLGPITRLLSYTEEEKKNYEGMDLAPTLHVPSMTTNPKTGDFYPAINKPFGVVHWPKHSKDAENVDWVVILDADMIIRGPIIPWELGAEKGKPVAAHYARQMMEVKVEKQNAGEPEKWHPKIHTIFSNECTPYFDWQTVGLVHSFHQSGQPGEITRLLSCTDEDLKEYKGHDLASTHYVPSMSRHPLTGDWYPAINKPAAVVHWVNHVKTDAEYIVILDADMIMRGPITPWEFNASKGRPVSTPYDYLIGCDNELARAHTRNPGACDKVGGVIIMHIRDLKRFALLWQHKTEEVRADMGHWPKIFTGDIYEAGWISEMYGYSFAAAEMNLRHVISNEILIYPGYVPVTGVNYRVFHYGLEFRFGNWSFDKAKWRHIDVVNKCWAKFPDPPQSSTLDRFNEVSLNRDLLSIECINSLNEALNRHHERKKCPDPNSLSPPVKKPPNPPSLPSPNRETGTEVITASGEIGEIDTTMHLSEVKNNESQALTPSAAKTNQTFSSMRFWIIGLWAFSIVSFIAVICRRKGQRKSGKTFKTKRRTTYQGLWDRSTGINFISLLFIKLPFLLGLI